MWIPLLSESGRERLEITSTLSRKLENPLPVVFLLISGRHGACGIRATQL